MKARFSAASAHNALNAAQKQAVAVCVEQMWERKKKVIMRRYNLAMCLALNDLHGFGDKRLMHVLTGIADILSAYASDSFTPTEGRNGSIESGDADPMADAMQAELLSRRKIHVEIAE